MPDHHTLAPILLAFARALVLDDPFEAALRQLCTSTAALLGVSGSGVVLAEDDGALVCLAASDESTQHIDSIQETALEGPCVTAYRSHEVIVVADLATETRWPTFLHAALGAGMRAVTSFPLSVESTCVGALDVYADKPWSPAADDCELGRTLAALACGYVTSARRQQQLRAHASGLEHALDARVQIEQAKGVLAGRHAIPIEEALTRLRGYARSQSRRLVEVARAVLDEQLDL